MLNSIEHIGIAVRNIESSRQIFDLLFDDSAYKLEEVASEHVRTLFYRTGPNKIELLEATNPEGAIAKFIDRKGEGIHHIAFEVSDIRIEMNRLRDAGFHLLQQEPKRGADGKWVCFVHPKSSNGVLIELCQNIAEGHE